MSLSLEIKCRAPASDPFYWSCRICNSHKQNFCHCCPEALNTWSYLIVSQALKVHIVFSDWQWLSKISGRCHLCHPLHDPFWCQGLNLSVQSRFSATQIQLFPEEIIISFGVIFWRRCHSFHVILWFGWPCEGASFLVLHLGCSSNCALKTVLLI